MSALIRISMYAVAAILALVIAAIVMKVVFALTMFALLAFASIYAYHFVRALVRKMRAPREPQMLTGNGPSVTTF